MQIQLSTFLFKDAAIVWISLVQSTIYGILLQKTCKLNISFWRWFLDKCAVVAFKTFIYLILKLRFPDLYVHSPSACLEPKAKSTKLATLCCLMKCTQKFRLHNIESVKSQQGLISVCNEMELSHVTACSCWFSINTLMSKSTCKVDQQYWFHSEIDWWFVVKYPVEIFPLTTSLMLKRYYKRMEFIIIFHFNCFNSYLNTSLNDYCIQGNIRPLFFSRPFHPRCLRANLRLGELQCLKWSLFKHNYFWANSRWGKTVCKRRRAKITRGENNTGRK